MLAGPKIVIIGVSSGIGAAALRLFAGRDAEGLGVGRDAIAGVEMGAEIHATARKTTFRRADMSIEDEVTALFAWISGE